MNLQKSPGMEIPKSTKIQYFDFSEFFSESLRKLYKKIVKIHNTINFRSHGQRLMPRCIKCGRDMEKTENGFCSLSCSTSALQEKIDEACKNDNSHTHNMAE